MLSGALGRLDVAERKPRRPVDPLNNVRGHNESLYTVENKRDICRTGRTSTAKG